MRYILTFLWIEGHLEQVGQYFDRNRLFGILSHSKLLPRYHNDTTGIRSLSRRIWEFLLVWYKANDSSMCYASEWKEFYPKRYVYRTWKWWIRTASCNRTQYGWKIDYFEVELSCCNLSLDRMFCSMCIANDDSSW
jgi:hypothetical protein